MTCIYGITKIYSISCKYRISYIDLHLHENQFLHMAKIISIVSHKGGVGKTTSAVNLAAALSLSGKKVLGVDLDAQAHFTLCTPVPEFDEHYVTGQILTKELTFEQVLLKGSLYDLLPSSDATTSLEKQLTKISSTYALKHAFRKASVRERYDYVIIDCPPALSTITENALIASDYIISSFLPEPLTYRGFQKMLEAIHFISEDDNPELKFGGVFFVRYHPEKRDSLAHGAVEHVTQGHGEDVFKTYIREDKNLKQLIFEGKSIFEFAPESNGAIDYMNLTKELINKFELKPYEQAAK